jgi:hypothetical protein
MTTARHIRKRLIILELRICARFLHACACFLEAFERVFNLLADGEPVVAHYIALPAARLLVRYLDRHPPDAWRKRIEARAKGLFDD